MKSILSKEALFYWEQRTYIEKEELAEKYLHTTLYASLAASAIYNLSMKQNTLKTAC